MTQPFTAEYGTFPESEFSKRTVLATGKGAFNRPFELVHKTAGYECAGSCARRTGEAWGSLSYDRNGTMRGHWFKTLAEARALFEKYTTPYKEDLAMPVTKTITLYTFDELPNEEAKESARNWYRQGNDFNFSWENIWEDAERIGLKIESLDSHEASKGSFDTSAPECAEAILREHGKDCDTYKTAAAYLKDLSAIGERPSDRLGERPSAMDDDREDQREELDDAFLRALLSDYYGMLENEIKYQNSDECVDENIRCNAYTFTETGKRED